jgi:RNA ligase (TIGR02306 family)
MTEKIDGQSASYFVTRHNGAWFGPKYTFGVCSRNIYLKTKHSCTWWNVAAQFDIENKLLSIGKDICIQGEIVGEGVQGNKYGLKGLDFYVFNVWDIATQSYYTYSDMVVLCNSLSLKTVPIINDRVTLPATIPEIVDMSKGKSVLNTKVHREGIVVRTMANMPNGEPVSFKCINPDFLLKFSDD